MDLQQQAIEFRTCYEVQNSPDNSDMQLRLIREEYQEFIEAEAIINGEPTATLYDYENALKELADLVYVCFQYAENREWDLLTALNRVHQSNMSKLDENKRPIRRDDGKILKGPNYKPPYLTDLV
jgi:NTP pyrophosphatase (non-canonical NTP hydrolase)